MRSHERFGGLQHFTGDLDQCPELAIGGESFQDFGDAPRIERTVGHATTQGAPEFDGQEP
ncbi:hypothetical protein D3C83_87960 [compost metagenome]